MKCPKCNFVSFDYNQACPRCGYDLSHERELLRFPSYQPKPLSLLGLFPGEGEVAAVADAPMGLSQASGLQGSDTQELLISLDSLADEDHEPAQLEPGASMPAPEQTIEKGPEATDNEFFISLDDFSDEESEQVAFVPETNAETPEARMEGEVFVEPETFVSEDASSQWQGLSESGVVEPEALFELEPDAGFEQEGVVLAKGGEGSGQKTEKGPDLFELELEPLELELDMEEEGPEKKIA